MDQPQSFGDFAHGHYTAVVHQVNLLTLLLPLPQEQGDLASTPTGDEEPYDMRETLFARSQTGRSTSCAFPYSYNYYNPSSQPTME